MFPSNPRSVSESFVAHCLKRAKELRENGLGTINPATVAYLLERTARTITDRHKRMARILKRTGSEDGQWHEFEVQEAYRLRHLSDEALAALDPDPPKPAPVLEQFAQLADFTKFLADKTQNAPRR